MGNLFNEKELFVKNRPIKITDKQSEDLYIKLANEVIKSGWSNDDVDVIAQDLSNLSMLDNGYEMAKDLEDFSSNGDYVINTSFCEWLESMYDDRREILNENVKQWVIAHNIKPKFAINNKFLVTRNFAHSFKENDIIYINNIYEDTGQYVIHKDSNYKGGTLIPFEVLEESCEYTISLK